MSCSKLANAAKRARVFSSVDSWSWQKLRENVFDEVLNGTKNGDDIGSCVSEIIEDMTGHRLVPMAMLKDKLLSFGTTSMCKANKSDYMLFVDEYVDRALPDVKLPFYKKQNGGLVECGESEALPRRSRWNLEIRFDTFYPRRNSRKKAWFRVHFRLVYRQRHESSSLPTTLDLHCNHGDVDHYFKLYGDLKQLMHNPFFLADVRYLVLTQIHRLKQTTFCTRVATKGSGKKKYRALCGSKCPEGLNSCHECLSKNFVGHFF